MKTKMFFLVLGLLFTTTLSMHSQTSDAEKKALEEYYSKQNPGYVSKEKILFSDLPVEDQEKRISEMRYTYFPDYDFSRLNDKEKKMFMQDARASLSHIVLGPAAGQKNGNGKHLTSGGENSGTVKDKTHPGTADDQCKEALWKVIEKYGIKKK